MSAQWVLRSASQGSLQRVVAISLDASRRLPTGDTAQLRSGSSPVDAGPKPAGIDGETLVDRAAREALLAQLTDQV